jgi:hypothetical protein
MRWDVESISLINQLVETPIESRSLNQATAMYLPGMAFKTVGQRWPATVKTIPSSHPGLTCKRQAFIGYVS